MFSFKLDALSEREIFRVIDGTVLQKEMEERGRNNMHAWSQQRHNLVYLDFEVLENVMQG